MLVLAGWCIPAFALFEDDVHVTSDSDAVKLDVDRRVLEEVVQLLDHGYPLQSIYLHGVGRGMPIDDMVFLATRARPAEAARNARVAIEMLPSLPAWACHDDAHSSDDRYAPVYSADELGPITTIREVSTRFFEYNERLSPFPNWSEDQVHARVPTSELRDLASEGHWYKNTWADRPENSGIFVSLYRHENRILIDGNLDQIAEATAAGEASMSVVIVYNDEFQRPVSDFGDVQTEDVVDAYFDRGLELTHVPNWNKPYGDFHHVSSIENIEQYVDLPEKDEIDEARWEALEVELSGAGFNEQPVLISIYENDHKVWVDEPERLTVAKSLGMDSAPVTYLYHRIGRLACASVPGDDCEDRIWRAAGLERDGGIRSTQRNTNQTQEVVDFSGIDVSSRRNNG